MRVGSRPGTILGTGDTAVTNTDKSRTDVPLGVGEGVRHLTKSSVCNLSAGNGCYTLNIVRGAEARGARLLGGREGPSEKVM